MKFSANPVERTKLVQYKNKWFFSLNYYAPHHPFDPPKEYLDKYMDKLETLPLPNYVDGELENKPLFEKLNHTGADNHHDSDNAVIIYDEMSDYEHRLIDTLKAKGQLEQTIILFHSDHGEMLGDHGLHL